MEATIEKYFNNNYYLLMMGSLFDSKYRGSDNITRNSAFNNTYTLNFLGGKELKLNNRYTLTINTKVSTAGGRYYTPIDLQKTINNNGNTVLVENEAFTKHFDSYFCWDFKIGLRENKKKFSQE